MYVFRLVIKMRLLASLRENRLEYSCCQNILGCLGCNLCVKIINAKAVKGSNDAYSCVKQPIQFNKTEDSYILIAFVVKITTLK